VLGSGSGTVTLNGTLAQINTTLRAANNVIYHGAHDDFGTDTLTMATNDNGNTGSGGPLADTDQVAIHLDTHLTGTPRPRRLHGPAGNERIDALDGVDTITFGFKLVEAKVSFVGNTVVIDGPSSHTVLTGFEVFNFTDGTASNNDADPLVDDLFYYSQYHDVWNAHVDADTHYHTYGRHEGRDPDAFFSTATYLSANPDVKAAGVDPLLHFDQFGWKEGRVHRSPSIPRPTLPANPDVKAAHVDLLAHFLANGAQEGGQPIARPSCSPPMASTTSITCSTIRMLAAAHVDPFQHFETIGWKEGRNPNALFDTAGYLAAYADVAAAHINALDHYHQYGWTEGRDPSSTSTPPIISATTPTSRRRVSIRCCISSTTASTKAARHSRMGILGEDYGAAGASNVALKSVAITSARLEMLRGAIAVEAPCHGLGDGPLPHAFAIKPELGRQPVQPVDDLRLRNVRTRNFE